MLVSVAPAFGILVSTQAAVCFHSMHGSHMTPPVIIMTILLVYTHYIYVMVQQTVFKSVLQKQGSAIKNETK